MLGLGDVNVKCAVPNMYPLPAPLFCQSSRLVSLPWHHLVEYHQVYVIYNKQKHAKREKESR